MTAWADATALDEALLSRQAWLERSGARWHALVHGATLAFVVMLYSNPMYWWPDLEKLRLAYVSAAVAAMALVAHRVVSGERVKVGLPAALPLFAYLTFIPLSLAWTLSQPDTIAANIEAAKMAVIFVVVQNAVDGPRRLRRFMLVAALASLGPALGAIDVWRNDDALIDGFRTHWRGMYGDPNRLAMSLIAVMPFSIYALLTTKKRWVRALFAATLAAQLGAIVLTHSRSGSLATAAALAFALFRGKRSIARKVFLGALIVAGVVAFAPETFWERNATITSYESDLSVEGRERSWQVLGVILEERPFTGVGAGAYLAAWDRFAPLSASGRHFIAHNILLEIVGELGVLAFGLFLWWVAWVVLRLWRAGDDPLIGAEARAIFAALAGYLVTEMANGFSLSWWLYFLFGCALAVTRLARSRAALTSGHAAPAAA